MSPVYITCSICFEARCATSFLAKRSSTGSVPGACLPCFPVRLVANIAGRRHKTAMRSSTAACGDVMNCKTFSTRFWFFSCGFTEVTRRMRDGSMESNDHLNKPRTHSAKNETCHHRFFFSSQQVFLQRLGKHVLGCSIICPWSSNVLHCREFAIQNL